MTDPAKATLSHLSERKETQLVDETPALRKSSNSNKTAVVY
jgi:hypothetical protein